MKKIITAIAIILVLGSAVNAQSDGFFSQQSFIEYRSSSDNMYTELPRIPDHGLTTNQDAPLGSGLLLLAGMGLAYGMRKKLKVEN